MGRKRGRFQGERQKPQRWLGSAAGSPGLLGSRAAPGGTGAPRGKRGCRCQGTTGEHRHPVIMRTQTSKGRWTIKGYKGKDRSLLLKRWN